VYIHVYIEEVGREDVEWFQLAQERVQWWIFVNTVMKFWQPVVSFFY
jgi:hypothetical protein